MKWLASFSLICFAWIFFRANKLEDALYIVKNLFNGLSIISLIMDSGYILARVISRVTFVAFYALSIFLFVIAIAVFNYIRAHRIKDESLSILFAKLGRGRYIAYWLMAVSILLFLWIQNATGGQAGSFIYFQF